jgi:hypothetical protein
VIAEVFRRLVLRELVRAERLSEEFRDVLMTWERSGFSVYGEQVVVEGELDPLEWIHVLGRQVPDPRQHVVRYPCVVSTPSASS